VPKLTFMYCVALVAVNLNHCSPFDVPSAHVLIERVVVLNGGIIWDVLNVIRYVPL